MFSFGFWEILVIGLIALIVVGPDRLPGVATFVGQWVGRLRTMARNMRNEIQQELEAEHLKNLLDEQNREISELRREVEGVREDADAAMRETQDDLGDVERDADRARSQASGDKRRQRGHQSVDPDAAAEPNSDESPGNGNPS